MLEAESSVVKVLLLLSAVGVVDVDIPVSPVMALLRVSKAAK
jgi:hypothetical protein